MSETVTIPRKLIQQWIEKLRAMEKQLKSL